MNPRVNQTLVEEHRMKDSVYSEDHKQFMIFLTKATKENLCQKLNLNNRF